MGALTPPVPGLRAKRHAARAALWAERLWPALWPPLTLLAAFAVAALLALPSYLPPWLRLAFPVAALLATLALLVLGLRRIVPPTSSEVDRRLEHDGGLAHRPLAALDDRPAQPGPEAAQLWAAHHARLAAQLRRLRAAPPRPILARHDVRALRGLSLIALAAALAIAGPDAPARLWAAVAPGLPDSPAAPGTLVQVWAAPPAYTGLPPIFLKPGIDPAPIPTGARLTIGVTGGQGTPTASLGPSDSIDLPALDTASWQAERTLLPDIDQNGEKPVQLTIRRGMQVLAQWTLPILPDHPPTVAFTDPPGPAILNGRRTLRTRFAWTAADDYGVATVKVELRLRDRPDADPIIVPMTLAGTPKTAHGISLQDLTAHPWAGLPVLARLVATDTPGQGGESPQAQFDLPERRFRNPLAQAVLQVRKQLSRAPDQRREAKAALDALADAPDLFDGSSSVLLHLRTAGALLRWNRGQTGVDEAQARLWSLALALEEVSPDKTAQTLAQARQAMRDAMDAAKQDPTDAAKQAELQQRMEELRQAIQRHIDALTQQARREGTEVPLDPNQPQMNARDLDKLAQQMQDAARDGKMDDAQQRMADLEKLLEQLQKARPEHGEQREQRNAERRQQGRQQQDAVQDLVQREGGLLDRSRSRADSARQLPQPGQPQAKPAQGDQKAQAAMRRALGELMQRFGDLTGQVPAPLSDADTAMRDAGQAMGEGRDADASAAQQRAIEALQKGGRAMGQQLSRQFGRGQPGEGEGQDGTDGQDMSDGDPGDGPGQGQADGDGGQDQGGTGTHPGEPGRRRTTRRDPFGRPLPQDDAGREQDTDGNALGTGPVPTDMEQARTRVLQDELRRRGADRTRRQDELDYIGRLLKPY